MYATVVFSSSSAARLHPLWSACQHVNKISSSHPVLPHFVVFTNPLALRVCGCVCVSRLGGRRLVYFWTRRYFQAFKIKIQSGKWKRCKHYLICDVIKTQLTCFHDALKKKEKKKKKDSLPLRSKCKVWWPVQFMSWIFHEIILSPVVLLTRVHQSDAAYSELR